MASIKSNFGSGGGNLTPSAGGTPSLATALRDVADDFEAVKAAGELAVVATADATDLASAVALANALKTKLNAVLAAFAALDFKTTKG